MSFRSFPRPTVLLESLANAAIVVSVVVGLLVWLGGIRSGKGAAPPSGDRFRAEMSTSVVGDRIELPGVAWGDHPATLVVAISSSCHFCVASTPFYSELTRSAHVIPIVVAMPETQPAAIAFLRVHAIRPNDTVSVPLPSIDVAGTPTLLLVSSTGTITKSWVGELSRAQQQQVLQTVTNPS